MPLATDSRYYVETTDLTQVADHIRTKRGISDTLTFPDDFILEIDNIVTGEGAAITIWDEDDVHGGIIRHIEAVDLSGDTVTPATLQSGITAHNALGEAIVGTGGSGSISTQDVTITPTTSIQTISAAAGYDAIGTVTVNAIPSQYIVPSGNITISANGTGIDVTQYATATVSVPSQGVSLQEKTNINPTTSSQTITADSGYDGLSSVQINAMPSGSVTSPASISGTSASLTTGTNTLTLSKTISVTPQVTTAGYVASGTAGNSAVSLTASVTTKAAATITPTTTNQTIASGTYLTGVQTIQGDSNLVAANIKKGISIFNVAGSYEPAGVSLQTKTGITPTETSQTITADAGYDGLSSVQIDAIDSYYIGSDVPQRTEDDVSITSRAEVRILSGYYDDNVNYVLPIANLANPTISVNTSTGLITATSNISSTGYIFSETTATNTSQLTTVNGTTITPTESEQTAVAANRYTLGIVKVGAISSTYVGSGITTRDSDDLTASGATVTAPAGYYASAASKSVATMTLPTAAASSATSGYTSKATISRSTSAQYINIPTGYNSTASYYTISATPNGSVTAPSSISGTTATVSTGTNTLTLTKTVSVTPNVTTAGYISSGTAGNSSVSLTASVTTKAAATITPTTSNQTIASGTYLTGTQTIAGDANLVGSNILSGTSIFGVAGTVTFQTIYDGTSAPSSSTGTNGDIYIQTA